MRPRSLFPFIGKVLRIFFLILGLTLLGGGPSFGQVPAVNLGGGYWFVQGEGGVNFPASSQEAMLYDPGYNGEAQLGYSLTKDFALGIETGFDFFPVDRKQAINSLEQQYSITGVTGSTNAGFTHISLDLMGRYYLPFPTIFRVYVLLGAGAAFDYLKGNFSISWGGNSLSGAFLTENWTNFELVPGLGVDFPLSNTFDLFAEGKVVLDFDSTVGSNPESNATPIVGIPVQAGVLFKFY